MWSAAYISAWIGWASFVSGIPIPADLPEPPISVESLKPGHAAETTSKGIKFDTLSDKANPTDICRLAHELTHWLQFYQPDFSFNPDKDEPIAYEVQIKCLIHYKQFSEARGMKSILEDSKKSHKW